MSKGQVDEWLHADRGSPWKHKQGGGMVGSFPKAGSVDPYIGLGMQLLAKYGTSHPGAPSWENAPYPALSANERRALAEQSPHGMTGSWDSAATGQWDGGDMIEASERQSGGALDPVSGGMLPGSANPMVMGAMQRYTAMPEEQLQELAARFPPNSPQGAMVNRALAMKRMHVASSGAGGMMPSPGAAGVPATAAPSAGPGILDQTRPMQQHRGGYVHRQGGGSMLGMPLSMASPWWERQEEHGMESGYLHGNTFGRSDHITTTAPGGAYIVPADVVSGLGEGNSLAGAAAVDHWLHTGPWGTRLSGGRRGPGPPRAPHPVPAYHGQPQAKGGGVQGAGEHGRVPVKLSHGEYQIGPRHVLAIGRYLLKKHGGKGANEKLAMKLGHDALDAWVVHERKRVADKMKNLPGPTRATGGRLAA